MSYSIDRIEDLGCINESKTLKPFDFVIDGLASLIFTLDDHHPYDFVFHSQSPSTSQIQGPPRASPIPSPSSSSSSSPLHSSQTMFVKSGSMMNARAAAPPIRQPVTHSSALSATHPAAVTAAHPATDPATHPAAPVSDLNPQQLLRKSVITSAVKQNPSATAGSTVSRW